MLMNKAETFLVTSLANRFFSAASKRRCCAGSVAAPPGLAR